MFRVSDGLGDAGADIRQPVSYDDPSAMAVFDRAPAVAVEMHDEGTPRVCHPIHCRDGCQRILNASVTLRIR
jgi:hypothetical protein